MSEVVFVAHKTLADGTSHEVTGGKTMDGGTVYDIALGKTMVDGTVHEIAFSSPIKVNITGTGNASWCYATVGGTKYNSPITLEVEPGTSITLFASSPNNTWKAKAIVTLNGKTVAQGTSSKAASYSFTPDAATVNITLTYRGLTAKNEISVTTS